MHYLYRKMFRFIFFLCWEISNVNNIDVSLQHLLYRVQWTIIACHWSSPIYRLVMFSESFTLMQKDRSGCQSQDTRTRHEINLDNHLNAHRTQTKKQRICTSQLRELINIYSHKMLLQQLSETAWAQHLRSKVLKL